MLFIRYLCILLRSRDSPFWAFFICSNPVNAPSYERLRSIVAEQVERAGAHLIDLVVRGERGTRVVEVFVDSEAGITSDVCTTVSREVGEAIERTREIEGAYRLDVSSPGIDRPLRYPWQYRKHVGRKVHVKLQRGQEPTERTGKLLAVDETGIMIEGGAQKEGSRSPFEMLQEVSVKAPW